MSILVILICKAGQDSHFLHTWERALIQIHTHCLLIISHVFAFYSYNM